MSLQFVEWIMKQPAVNAIPSTVITLEEIKKIKLEIFAYFS